jgi:hypothetical protein
MTVIQRPISSKETVMKILRNVIAVASAAAVIAMPVMASAAPAASKLSVSKSVRAGTAVRSTKASNLGGGSTIIAVLAAAAVIGGIAIAAGGSNKPKSP